MKTVKTTIAALVLVTVPMASHAMCSYGAHKTETAMSCAEGMVYDSEKGVCIAQTSS